MFQKFQAHLSKNFPELISQKMLLALSGGVDSCVLLSLCLREGLHPAIAHCNFQLRGKDSDADALWIEQLAEEHGLECHIKNFDARACAGKEKLSIQMAARNLRYEWFETLSKEYGYEVILVGHHADDSLETFMINTMRGSGLKGLLGIPEFRGKILRPLLPFGRKDIMRYAKENQIQWREDASNAKTDYLRNALRHKVIPGWKAMDKHFDEQFRATLAHLGKAQEALEFVLEQFKTKHL